MSKLIKLVPSIVLFSISTSIFAGSHSSEFYQERMKDPGVLRALEEKTNACNRELDTCRGYASDPRQNDDIVKSFGLDSEFNKEAIANFIGRCEEAHEQCITREASTPEMCKQKQEKRRENSKWDHHKAEKFSLNQDRALYHSCLGGSVAATAESRACEGKILEKISRAGWQEGGLNQNFSFNYPGLESYEACMDQIVNPRPAQTVSWGQYFKRLVGWTTSSGVAADHGRNAVTSSSETSTQIVQSSSRSYNE